MSRIALALAVTFVAAACSGPTDKQEDLCADAVCGVGYQCETTTGECVAVDPGTDAGEDPADAGEDPADAGEDPADAGEDPADAGEDPTDAGEDPADAGEDPVDAGEDPVDAGEDPVDAGEDPVDAGEDPVDAGEDPADGGELACGGTCSGSTPVCDEETDTCVACTATAGCSNDASVCDLSVAGGQCVTCTATEGCSDDASVCDLSVAGGACVTCTATEGCSGDTPVCDLSVAGGACVQCVDESNCEGETPACLMASNVCVGCVDDGHCANPSPVCEDNDCRGCQNNGECDVTAFCEDTGACRPLPDTCALALDVALPSPVGVVSFVADTTHMKDDTNGTCSSGAGAELVYRLPLAQAADVIVTAKPAAGSSATPRFYLRQGVCETGDEAACINDASTAATLLNQSGDLFLFIETAGATRGAVDVTVTLEPPTPNDTCATASEGLLTFDASGHAEATGSTLRASNDNPKTSCSMSARDDGQDVVHSFVLEEIKNVTVRLEATAGSPLQPVVGVWRMEDCETGTNTTELACQGDINRPTQVAGVLLRDLTPGTYAVLVDGAAQTSGGYKLSVDLSDPAPPPQNEDCDTAEELVFFDDVATVAGDSWEATNDHTDTPSDLCSPTARSSGRDLFYKFTIAPTPPATTRNLIARLIPTGAAPTLKPVLALRPEAGCASGTPELACKLSSQPTAVELQVSDLSEGTWYLHVDSMGDDAAGPFELEVLLSDPPPPAGNDDCSAPEELTFTDGRASAVGNLLSATNAGGTLTCSTGAGNQGKDVVYEYTLDQATSIAFAVVPDDDSTAGLAPVVAIRDACKVSAGAALACKAATTGGRVVAHFETSQAAGTYWLWVDAHSAAAGPFKLDVQTGVPANDDCSSPHPLTAGQKVVGHTSLATDDYPSYACTRCTKFPGKDLVYAYTETIGGSRTVTVRPSQVFDAGIVRIEGSCSADNAVVKQDDLAQGYAEQMTFDAVAGTTYWFVVDGVGTSNGSGSFEIEVK